MGTNLPTGLSADEQDTDDATRTEGHPTQRSVQPDQRPDAPQEPDVRYGVYDGDTLG